MERCARRHSLLSGPLLAAGDFNAKSPLWGSPRQDGKGRALQEWAAGLGLCILNTGTTSTCVWTQGVHCRPDMGLPPGVPHGLGMEGGGGGGDALRP